MKLDDVSERELEVWETLVVCERLEEVSVRVRVSVAVELVTVCVGVALMITSSPSTAPDSVTFPRKRNTSGADASEMPRLSPILAFPVSEKAPEASVEPLPMTVLLLPRPRRVVPMVLIKMGVLASGLPGIA